MDAILCLLAILLQATGAAGKIVTAVAAALGIIKALKPYFSVGTPTTAPPVTSQVATHCCGCAKPKKPSTAKHLWHSVAAGESV